MRFQLDFSNADYWAEMSFRGEKEIKFTTKLGSIKKIFGLFIVELVILEILRLKRLKSMLKPLRFLRLNENLISKRMDDMR